MDDLRKTETEWATAQVEESIRVHQEVRSLVPSLTSLAERMAEVFRSGGRVYFFGNGGSAADAQHWAAELSGRFYLDRPGLPAMALTTNSSEVTAISNDFGYENVFRRPLEAMARAGDMAVGISTSGNSANVVAALRAGQERGVVTVRFTGAGDGAMAELADHWIEIPSPDTPRIQEGHEICGHVLCGLVERLLFGQQAG